MSLSFISHKKADYKDNSFNHLSMFKVSYLLLILTTVQISIKTHTNNFSDNGFYIFMSIKGIVNCKINRYQMISNSLIYKYVGFLNIFIIQVIKSEK